jgi:ABC-2 type transport system permease protein
MNKMFLVMQREFMSRVKKKSFLIATILVPLIFPAVFGGMIYLAIQNEQNKDMETVRVLDESGLFVFEDDKKYEFEQVTGNLEDEKNAFKASEDLAMIYIPKIDIYDPKGISFYTQTSPGVRLVSEMEGRIEQKIRDIKLVESGLSDEQLDKIKTNISLASFNITETGGETRSDAESTFWIGYVMGFMIYIFLFAYGAQVMQGVIEEKNSKIVEIVVSTIKPIHMMMGKVIGVASVGVVQFLIWILLMTAISVVGISAMGLSMDPAQVQEMANAQDASSLQQNEKVMEMMEMVNSIPILQITLLFIFYFLGGYLLYGALFAAVGSAVDTPADAQQFMMPIMLPIIIALMGLMMFVFPDPHGTASFWLSIIPFTSPIVMMGRIGFGVPAWEIGLSMVLLVLGFWFTLWLAGRIYRVGILMHGTKVNYKTLARWFMMKN